MFFKLLRFAAYAVVAVVFGLLAGFSTCEAAMWFCSSLASVAALFQFADELKSMARKLYSISKILF